jgi:hypothetical protein
VAVALEGEGGAVVVEAGLQAVQILAREKAINGVGVA